MTDVPQHERTVAGIANHQLATTTATSQQTSQQSYSSLGGAGSIAEMSVVRHHLLDLLEPSPANVALRDSVLCSVLPYA